MGESDGVSGSGSKDSLEIEIQGSNTTLPKKLAISDQGEGLNSCPLSHMNRLVGLPIQVDGRLQITSA
jgi:hypothetical protein